MIGDWNCSKQSLRRPGAARESATALCFGGYQAMAPLTRRRKRALAVAAAPPVIHPADRLSRLPDEILAQILSFLPAQEAVRTCVLARAWRDVWKFTRRLRITGGTVQGVREFVDRLLRLRLNGLECVSLDECEIMIGMHDDHDTRCTVDRWIHHSLKCQVQALRVLNERQAPHLMSDRPLISQHLTRLELSGIWFECINLNLDGCPVLEHLEINECYLAGVRKIMSPSLKRLVITECDSNKGHLSFKISAPCLVSLWLEVGKFRAALLESMPELVEAHVRIDSYWWRRMGWVLLEGLAQAKDLVLLAQHSMSIFRRDLRSCPTFSHLKDLVLNGYWCEPADCCALACILEHAPVLERLTVLFSEKVELEYDIVLEGRPDATAKSTLTTQCLKIVKVKCNTVHKGVQNVLKFLSTLNICLYAEVDKEQLVEGANLMLELAKCLMAAQHTRHGGNLQLTDGEPQDPEEDLTNSFFSNYLSFQFLLHSNKVSDLLAYDAVGELNPYAWNSIPK